MRDAQPHPFGLLHRKMEETGAVEYSLEQRPETDAEDLTQEIFLALCRKCDYDPARGSLSAFLVTLNALLGTVKS